MNGKYQEMTTDSGGAIENGDTPSHIALLEVWMGLPGHGTEHEAISKLRKSLDRSACATNGSYSEARTGGGGDEQDSSATSASTLEVRQNQISVQHHS